MRNTSSAVDVLRALWRCARHCAGISALAAAPLLAWHASAPAAEPRTWIVGATVISPERADPGRKLHVLIDGDRIAALAEQLPPDAAQNAQLIDATGGYLIPGLIDSHVHLQTVPGLSPLMHFRHAGSAALWRERRHRHLCARPVELGRVQRRRSTA